LKSWTPGWRRLKKVSRELKQGWKVKLWKKIRALFDDREVQNDRFDRINNRLDKLTNDTTSTAKIKS